MAIFQDDVGCVVGGELDQGEVLLRHHGLLNPSMPEGMEGVEGGVQLHLLQSELEPLLKLVVQHWSHFSLKVPSLEQRRVGTDVGVANHAAKGVNSPYGTQDRAVVVPGEWNLLDSLGILDGLRLVQS